MADSPERPRSFFISAGEAAEGPFDLATLRERLASGRIDQRYQIWDDGAGSWAPFSMLEELAGTSARVRPVRAPISPSNPMWEPPPAAAGERSDLSEAEVLKVIVPRVVSQRIGGTYAPEAPTGEGPAKPPPEKEAPPGAEPVSAPPPPRRRIYSPMSAGANVSRPFAPVRAPGEEGEQPSEPANDIPSFEFTEEPAGMLIERPAIWPIAATCVGLCVLTLAAFWIAGLVTFGVHAREDKLRLTNELAAAQQTLAAKERGLKRVLADKEDYLNRFEAAQVAVRNIRVSVFASAKRQLRLSDGPELDQRLFELDQLNRLVPENEEERKIRHELTDAFFSVRNGSKAPAPEASASPVP